MRCPGPLAPVHRCARSVCYVASAVSWATGLLFSAVPAPCVALRVRCPGPLSSCSPVCPLRVLLCVCGVLGHLAPVHRCTRVVCCAAFAVSWATWLLFTGAPAWCVALLVRSHGPLGSCSPVCLLGVLCFLCGVLGHLPPVHRCACSVRCFACAVSLATWLLFTGVPAQCVLCCVCGVLTHLAPVHRCACSVCVVLRVRCPGPLGSCSPVRWVCCVACAVSWATWLLFTRVPAWCVVLFVRCPGPLASCSPVCPLGALLCVCGVLGHLALVHWCARSVCVVLRVRCPGPLGSCSPVCPLGVFCVACAVSWATWLLFTSPLGVLPCVCGVLGHLAPVHWCASSVRCFVCAVSWATWVLFNGVPAWVVVLRLRCPRPLGSCSPERPLGAWLYWCGLLGHLAPVHQCARPVCCVASALSWATWLLFTGVPARCIALRERCPGPLGSCSLVCPLVALPCVCSVLGHLAAVHRCARSVGCVACAVSGATCLLFTGVPAPCAVLRVRCPGPLGSCSPMCPLGGLCCVCGVRGHLPPVHRCACLVCCVACAVSW